MHGLFRTQKRRSAATDSRLYYDRVPFVINSSHAQDSRRDALTGRPLRYRIQAIKNERRPQAAKNTRPAACERRPAGPLGPKFDERTTTYDERLYTRPSAPK